MKGYRLAAFIVNEVAEEWGIPTDILTSKTRKHSIVLAKREAQIKLRNETDLSLQEIADMFNYKDHTTVVYHTNDDFKLRHKLQRCTKK